MSTAGQEAIDAYELTGNRLNPWQRLVLRDALGEREDGQWAAFEVGLVVARQNGKDEVLIARELAGLFVWGERLIIHSAHKFDTAMEHLERLATLIDEVPEFRKRVRKVNRSHGQEGITLRSGARIRFRARTRSGGGRGYTRAGCVIFNEAMDIPEELVGMIMPTMSAESMRVPGPQIWFAGSAVDEETMSNGLVLARVREAGIVGTNERLAYFEFSAEDDADPTDWHARAQANPSLGYQISAEYIETEFQSSSMSPRQFGIERLGMGFWPDTSEDAGRVIGREKWAAIAEHDPSQRVTKGRAFALDGDPDQTRAAIGAAGKRDDGLFQFTVIAHRPGTDWLLDACRDLRSEFPGSRFAIDKRGPLKDKIDDFKRAKLRVIEANADDYATACSSFYSAVDERRCRYPAPQPELDNALAGAVKAPLGDAWKWSRRNSDVDISPLVACTLALWAAEQRRSSRIINLNALEDE